LNDALDKYEHRRESQQKDSGLLGLLIFVRKAAVGRRGNKMPINKVKGGYRWGKEGKVYKSKEKARKQGIAILISQRKIKVKGGTYKK